MQTETLSTGVVINKSVSESSTNIQKDNNNNNNGNSSTSLSGAKNSKAAGTAGSNPANSSGGTSAAAAANKDPGGSGQTGTIGDPAKTVSSGSGGGAGESDRSRKRLVEEMPSPTCQDCYTIMDNLHVCLFCDYCGCWRHSLKSNSSSHIVKHLKESGHEFALDFNHFEIYCNTCGDYIYDPGLINFIRGLQIRWYAALCDAAEPEAKRPRIVPTGADFNMNVQRYIKDHGTINPCGGLRGLRNLGATCYLSVVIQSLLHNPMIRNWILNDGHFPDWCRVGRHVHGTNNPKHSKIFGNGCANGLIGGTQSEFLEEEVISDGVAMSGRVERHASSEPPYDGHSMPGGNGTSKPKICFTCELISLYNRLHSDSTTPIAPTRLLYALWITRPDLSGYGQQDSHECFISLLDQMHTEIVENSITPPPAQSSAAGASAMAAKLLNKKDRDDISVTGSIGGTTASPVGSNSNTPLISSASFSPKRSGIYSNTTSSSLGMANSSSNCSCIIHQTFGGILQSTVTCSKCDNTTTAYDPMLDVSLDISESRGLSILECLAKKWMNQNGNHYNHGGSNTKGIDLTKKKFSFLPDDTSITNDTRPSVVTLQDCLEKFTSPEILPKGVYTCSQCKTAEHGASKRLCIKQLSPVLAFQLKRFEHGLLNTSKIDTYVRLPLELDMTPYTASALASQAATEAALKSSNSTSNINGVTTAMMPNTNEPIIVDGPGGTTSLGKRRTDATHSSPACQYGLFAVISHSGALDTGHYVMYAKHRGQWFRFDDAMVTKASISDVLQLHEGDKAKIGLPTKGMAYMAFYIKQTLDYNDVVPGDIVDSLITESNKVGGADSGGGGSSGIGGDGGSGGSRGGTGLGGGSGAGGGAGIGSGSGATRMRLGPNGDMKIERRGRKKGSTNAARRAAKEEKEKRKSSGSSDIKKLLTKQQKKNQSQQGGAANSGGGSISDSASEFSPASMSASTLSPSVLLSGANDLAASTSLMATGSINATNSGAASGLLPGILEEGEVLNDEFESELMMGDSTLLDHGSVGDGSNPFGLTTMLSGRVDSNHGLTSMTGGSNSNASAKRGRSGGDDDDDDEPLLYYLDKDAVQSNDNEGGDDFDELRPMTHGSNRNNNNKNEADDFDIDNSLFGDGEDSLTFDE
ncbi:hypothetical protein H4219_004972 [Mycoemilia scoparia]|uniref:Ubiquitinyl hydrolase 1 n=1 Tax=Mycoemilia scoparia TaxID=417184 RepID=A0A9W7ZQT2_9FUNG|nr:hypothetical protein H4219_004972 [Mycoemilia scoparia]